VSNSFSSSIRPSCRCQEELFILREEELLTLLRHSQRHGSMAGSPVSNLFKTRRSHRAESSISFSRCTFPFGTCGVLDCLAFRIFLFVSQQREMGHFGGRRDLADPEAFALKLVLTALVLFLAVCRPDRFKGA